MRGLFWVILLTALAVAITVAARYQTGYVLVLVHPYRIELSLSLLAGVLLLAFVTGYFAVRLIARTLRLPSEVKEYRERRRIDRAYRMLVEALRAYFEGRYAKAERAASEVLETHEFAGLAAVIAARSANELRAYERRDRFLARAAYFKDEDQAMRVIAQAEIALQERDHRQALDALARLPHKHVAALRLELKAVQQSRTWDRYIAILELLAHANAIDERQAEELRRHAVAQNLARKARDADELASYWKRLERADRRDPVIAAAAVRAFAELGNNAEILSIIESSLENVWDSGMVALYGDFPSEDWRRQIELAEKWLVQHPADATLLLTLGRLCLRQQLWGKARSYFEAGLSLEATYGGHMELAHLLDQIGEPESARTHYRRSLELAANALRGHAALEASTESAAARVNPNSRPIPQMSVVAGVNESQKN